MLNEIGVLLIFYWRVIEVWFYIFSRKLKYNLFYVCGFDRIGCFFCLSVFLVEFERLKREKFEFWEKWKKVLEYWRECFDFLEEWVIYGFWCWKKFSKGEKLIVWKLGVDILEECLWELVKV